MEQCIGKKKHVYKARKELTQMSISNKRCVTDVQINGKRTKQINEFKNLGKVLRSAGRRSTYVQLNEKIKTTSNRIYHSYFFFFFTNCHSIQFINKTENIKQSSLPKELLRSNRKIKS